MIRKQAFGKTGHMSTVTLFGAAALAQVTQEEADRALETLQEYGVNHIDTAASYGEAELRIGPWMRYHRKEFFLATKTEKRTYQEAREQIHRSLDRLQTDHVDLLQLHCLIRSDEWDTAMGPGGALEAAIEAREQGLTRFIGVTGHDWHVPQMHMKSLERFPFDSVLLPLNYFMMCRPDYRQGFEQLRKICREREIAFQTIKSIARAPWNDNPKVRACWYEPFEDQADIDRAVHYVLGHEGVFLNMVGDIYLMPRVLDAASRFTSPPPDESMREMAEATGMCSLFAS